MCLKVNSFIGLLLSFVSLNSCGYDLITLGTPYGGWTIPQGFLNPRSIVYCAGAGEDISFDVALVDRYGCQVYIFDPTLRAKMHFEGLYKALKSGEPFYTIPDHRLYQLVSSQLDKLHFMAVGLWSKDTILKFFVPRNPAHVSHSVLNLQKTDKYFEAPCKSLKTIMNELGHDHLDLLKLDIEGAEYAVLDSILENNIDIKCICLEFDELAGVNKACNTDIKKSIQKIERYIDILKQHGYKVIYQKGYVDMTFLKRDK